MNTRTVGKLQIWVGSIFLILTIIGAIFVGNFYYNNFVHSSSKLTEAWGYEGNASNDFYNNTNLPEEDIVPVPIFGHMVSYLVINTATFLTSAPQIAGIILILLLLSLMMIFQGLANFSKNGLRKR